MTADVSERSFLSMRAIPVNRGYADEPREVRRPSVTAFFPCYNDSPTIAGLVLAVEATLRNLTDDFEIIVVNDGSQDGSAAVLNELQRVCGSLRVVTHDRNRGYGGALQSGFRAATKDLVFYTDGDGQYDPRELADLFAELATDDDVVQGWKMKRSDPWYRTAIGWSYCQFVRKVFGLKTRDVDCDFRLIRKYVLDSFVLTTVGGSITVELVSRIERGGFRMREVPVHHYPRLYGRSQFFGFRRILRTFWGLAGLWMELHFNTSPAQPSPERMPSGVSG